MDFRELSVGQVVAVQNFLMGVSIAGVDDVAFRFFFLFFSGKCVQLSLVIVFVVDTETLGVETI